MNIVETSLRTNGGAFRILCNETAGSSYPDFALVHGEIAGRKSVVTRVQSECITGHVFHSLSCDCYEQLQDAMSIIRTTDCGLLIYLRQEGRGIGLSAKLRSYILQRQGLDTVDANLQLGYDVDGRTYEVAADFIRHLKVSSVQLLTNNPRKANALKELGIHVEALAALPPVVREENRRYLETKRSRLGHTFQI